MYFTDSLYDVLPDNKDVGPFSELFGGGENAGENYGATGERSSCLLPRPAAMSLPPLRPRRAVVSGGCDQQARVIA